MTLNEHAEAILRAAWPGAGLAHFSLAMDCNGPAILAALQALHTESFDAGAKAMREAAAKEIADHPERVDFIQIACIRAIDPATLEGRNA